MIDQLGDLGRHGACFPRPPICVKLAAEETFIPYGLLLLLQASAAPAAPAAPRPPAPTSAPAPATPSASAAPVVYDTRAVTGSCRRDVAGDAILVCGRRGQDRYRLPRLPADDPALPAAETAIGGARVGVGTEQGDVAGRPSNRVMAHVRIPF